MKEVKGSSLYFSLLMEMVANNEDENMKSEKSRLDPFYFYGVSASLSASAVFDAAGTWKVVSNDCSGFPLPDQFENSVIDTVNDVQTFSVPGFLDEETGVPVAVTPSEGTLNAQTGAYKLCYSSEISDCQVNCTGTVDAANHVDLNCNKPNGDLICKMTLKK
jgi:hypothetical protein